MLKSSTKGKSTASLLQTGLRSCTSWRLVLLIKAEKRWHAVLQTYPCVLLIEQWVHILLSFLLVHLCTYRKASACLWHPWPDSVLLGFSFPLCISGYSHIFSVFLLHYLWLLPLTVLFLCLIFFFPGRSLFIHVGLLAFYLFSCSLGWISRKLEGDYPIPEYYPAFLPLSSLEGFPMGLHHRDIWKGQSLLSWSPGLWAFFSSSCP